MYGGEVSEPAKIRYEIALGGTASTSAVENAKVRSITAADRKALAGLMLDAYLGTIDYEDETLDDAIDEIDSWFGGHAPMLDHSYCAVVDGGMASAVLVSEYQSVPFIGYVMTRAAQQERGLARLVTETALNSLSEAGHGRVVFYITDGNTASEALFTRLGAHAVAEP